MAELGLLDGLGRGGGGDGSGIHNVVLGNAGGRWRDHARRSGAVIVNRDPGAKLNHRFRAALSLLVGTPPWRPVLRGEIGLKFRLSVSS